MREPLECCPQSYHPDSGFYYPPVLPDNYQGNIEEQGKLGKQIIPGFFA
ncbi:MAG: hypothetical protein LH609_14365 [Rudanella sp.]|nr:hypothetical protein [Rudanella sp.]